MSLTTIRMPLSPWPRTFRRPAPTWFSCLVAAAVLLTSGLAQAAEPEEVYLPLFHLIQQADTLNTQDQPAAALPKYQTALDGLRTMQVQYPAFNVKMVAYRSNDVAMKIAAINSKLNPSAEAESTTASSQGKQSKSVSGTSMTTEQVKLLSPGSEPRKAMRLHPAEGDKQTLTMTLKMGMDIKVGEMETPMKLPTMIMTMESTVKSISPEGDISYETVMTDATVSEDPDVMPQVLETMKNSLGSLKGITSTGVLSSRGVNKGTDIQVPAGADAQTKQAMDQMKESFGRVSAPFPEEPIGVGGKWEAKMKIKSQGLTIDQTATYELVSLEGEVATAKTTMTQTAANQKIQNPAMPGLNLDLIKMNGKGTGGTSFDLTRLFPPKGDMDMQSELVMGMNTGGQKQSMNMKMTMKLGFEGK